MKTSITLLAILGLLSASVFAAEPASLSSAEPATRACKIIETAHANYPIAMEWRGVKHGTVRVVLKVSEAGRLDDVLVTAYTHHLFADEVMRVVKKWQYEPSFVEGRAVPTIMNLTFKFEVDGMIAIDRKDFDALPVQAGAEDGFAFQARGMKNLDSVPTPVKMVNPTYPQEWAAQGITGNVTVDCYIDEKGRIRMASCPDDANPKLAGIALAAVQQWEFTPPTCKGKPVLAHARQEFAFGEPSATP